MKRKFQVLLVEDNKLMNNILRIFIKSKGLNVDSTLTYNDAVKKIEKKKGKYDVLIVDYNLNKNNGNNGMDVYEKLRAVNPEIKAIMISANGTDSLKKEAYIKGIKYFLDKPFLLDELSNRLYKIKLINFKNQ